MTENIKSQTSSKKEDKKINKASDIEVLLSGNKNGLPIHLRNRKILNPRDLKNDFVDLDEGSVSVTNAPSRKTGERIEVQFESLPIFQVFCEKFNRFKRAGIYLQEAVVSRQNSRNGLLTREDIKKISVELESRMKSFEGKLKSLNKEFKSDYVLPEEKTYKLMCSQNSLIANHFIDQAKKADRIICVLDYLYSKGKLGSLMKGILVRNRTTTDITLLVSRYMDSIIHLEEGVKNIRLKRQKERDKEEARIRAEKEEAQRQAELQKRMNKPENDKAKKEKAEMRATAKVYKPDETGRMVLVDEYPEKRTQTTAVAASEKREVPQTDVQPEKVEQAQPLAETVEQGQAQPVSVEQPQADAVSVEQGEPEQVLPEQVAVETPKPVEAEVASEAQAQIAQVQQPA